MRKDIKKRLEKALITLQEPGGSTIRAIIKVINHDSPFLSLRKLLEALQEGVNEGFLCMYNGRFKLREQLLSGKETRMSENSAIARKEKMKKENTPDNNFPDEESDDELEEEEEEKNDDDDDDDDEDDDLAFTLATNPSTVTTMMNDNQPSKPTDAKEKPLRKMRSKKRRKRTRGKKQKHQGRVRMSTKKPIRKPVARKNLKMSLKSRQPKKPDPLLLADSSSTIPEGKLSKPTSEKPDLRRQRGPRCTSMKKDVRMPSKVHIPFVPPSMPQRGGNFNDLVRRSPDPVNGPLFDDYRVGLGLFENYC